MLLDSLKQFNWVDVFIVIVLLRICYVAIKGGFSIELFKLLGTITAIYVSCHYYTVLSDVISGAFPMLKDKMSLQFRDFLCFVILAIAGYLAFVILRMVFSRFIKLEAVPKLNKWGGFVLGICRGLFITSLIIFMFIISTVGYLNTSVKKSYLGMKIYAIAPSTYSFLWSTLISKFASNEKFNKTVTEIQQDFR